MPIDAEKRKSSQSPNKRREAFKRKRKESEKNEACLLKEQHRPIEEKESTEPIYQNLYNRPTPQKPKRMKLPSSNYSQPEKQLSAIDLKTEEVKRKILLEHEQNQNKKSKKKSIGTLCKELKQKMAPKLKNKPQKQLEQQER